MSGNEEMGEISKMFDEDFKNKVKHFERNIQVREILMVAFTGAYQLGAMPGEIDEKAMALAEGLAKTELLIMAVFLEP